LTPDVCIVGGGPAGAALACALSQSEFFQADGPAKKIIVVDGTPNLPKIDAYKKSTQERVPEPRVVTLSPSSVRLLRSIGAFDAATGCD